MQDDSLTYPELTSDFKLARIKALLADWTAKQGHASCWYYPEIYTQLAEIVGLTPPQTPNVPLREFVDGCRRYQAELYGPQEACLGPSCP